MPPEEIVEAIKKKSPEAAEVARRILDWSYQNFTQVRPTSTTFVPELRYDSKTFGPFSIQRDGRLYLYRRNIQKNSDIDEDWLQLRDRLNGIGPGLSFSEAENFPSIMLSALADNNAGEAFLRIIAWSIERVRAAHPEQSVPVPRQSV